MKPVVRIAPWVLAWLGWISELPVEAAAPRYDPDALRSLSKIPPMQVVTGFGYSSDRGFMLGEESFDPRWNRPPAERIRELESGLKGDERDAELLLEMAQLAPLAGATNRANQWIEKSQAYFRSRVASAAEDGRLQVRYGEALRFGGRWEEAERAHRAAVDAAPRDWRNWSALGDFMWRRAGASLWPTNTLDSLETLPRGRTLLVSASPEARVAARRYLDEAEQCLDRAVEAGPAAFETYANRYLLKWIRRFIFDTSMESVASEGTARAFPDAPMLADLRRAAELTTTNGFLIGMSATFQLWFEKGGEFDPAPGAAWAGGSEAGKAHVRDQLARLERLTESGSARVAGAAGAASATVRLLLMGDFSRAEREARGSLARYPDGDGALEVVIACLVLQEKWGELASVAEERLRHKESTRLRMMLAKSFERRSLWKEARAQVERAAIAAPGDFFVLLAGVALALRDSAGPSDTEAVLKRMADMKAGPFDAADAELQAYFEFLHGIAYGLAGDLAEARRHFRRLLAAHPGNPDYRKAMEAVGP